MSEYRFVHALFDSSSKLNLIHEFSERVVCAQCRTVDGRYNVSHDWNSIEPRFFHPQIILKPERNLAVILDCGQAIIPLLIFRSKIIESCFIEKKELI